MIKHRFAIKKRPHAPIPLWFRDTHCVKCGCYLSTMFQKLFWKSKHPMYFKLRRNKKLCKEAVLNEHACHVEDAEYDFKMLLK